MKVLPWKFGPGPFEMSPRLIPEDPRSDYPLDIDVLSGRTLAGTISMPWFEVTPITDRQAAVAAGEARQTVMHYAIRNVGNRPVELQPWERYDQSSPAVELTESSCSNTALAPGASCRVAFRVQPDRMMAKQYAGWGASSVDGRVFLTLNGRVDEDSKFGVTVTIQ